MNADWGAKVDALQLLQATRLVAHRGPDGEGFLIEDNVGFGHRRLAIVDLSGGAQPLANEDGSIWVTYNGEIYNHRGLRSELEGRGHRFATRSDTEVLVHGYEEWGDDLPSHLRGMFAFAIWDRPKRRVLLARDRLGVKPLYWTRAGRDLVFASEIKSLFAFGDVARMVDESRIPHYLALRYVPGPRTIFRGIERLQPGHALSFQGGRLKTWPYWDVPVEGADPPQVSGRRSRPLEPVLSPGGKPADVDEAVHFSELLRESVEMRLMGDVPVGLFLSGGIDSTAVGWAMKQADPSVLKSFSVGFKSDPEGELSFARLAADAIGTEHREVVLSSALFRDSIEDLAWHLDEPLSDGACIPLMHLAKRAWQEVVIVLSGEGADELLGGYQIYGKMLAIERAQALFGGPLKTAAGMAMRLVRHPKLKKYLSMAQKPLPERYFGVGRGFGDELLTRAFGPGAVQGLVSELAPYWERSRHASPLDRMLYFDTKVWLPDELLIKADKMTMAWAVELRVPFLDHVLLEHTWRLPPQLNRKLRFGKQLLRKAVKNKVPEPILNRPKKGFPVPIGRWLRGPLYEACREELLARTAQIRFMIGRKLIEQLLEEHRKGWVDRTEELYALWVYEAWRRTFLSSSKRIFRHGMADLRRPALPRVEPRRTPTAPGELHVLRSGDAQERQSGSER
jgi:asparagine synthase (glutamine-hydrolysing)